MATVCKTCGGPVNRSGNYYVCEYCRNKWEIDSGNDIHAVDRANAWSALRDGDFEKAAELFESIIVKEPQNHEAYWGRALAMGGIVYVTDLNENKKVPTCNNITEESFVNGKDVQKAISLAPADIAANYNEQAEYIEKVRIEWLEKASKEPAYDIFISFKDSDRENGIDRTQDSVDAQDLYNALIAEGYKVFFSRISLRDKISEQYEPYIYNAIKTAKVMIVFGEKPEYFSSAWIKNEWVRFKNRIEKGEKHKNSLVVVYKNMNPGDLPVVLRSRQCLNAADMTFLSDLNRHIKRVIEEMQNTVRLERVEIVSGQIATKATQIGVSSIQTRALGEGVAPELSISEKQTLSLAKDYLGHSNYEKAAQLSEDILFDNPGNSDAILISFLASQSVADPTAFIDIDHFNAYDNLHKVLSITDKETAKAILVSFYKNRTMVPQEYAALLHEILPYVFDERARYIEETFKFSIDTSSESIFEEVLPTIDTNDVDLYIDKLYAFATKLLKNNNVRAQRYIQRILEVDPAHTKTLDLKLKCDVTFESDPQKIVATVEEMLKYSANANKKLMSILGKIMKFKATGVLGEVCKRILQYYSGDLVQIKEKLFSISTWLIFGEVFDTAEYFLRLILNFDKNDPEIYKSLCLIKAKAKDFDSLITAKVILHEIPEFDKYMSMCSPEEREALFDIQQKNKNYFHIKRNAVLAMHQTVCWRGSFVVLGNGNVLCYDENIKTRYSAINWTNIVSLHEYNYFVLGLRADGTIMTDSLFEQNKIKLPWRNIVKIAMLYDSEFYGLTSNGTILPYRSKPQRETSFDKQKKEALDKIGTFKNIDDIFIVSTGIHGICSDGRIMNQKGEFSNNSNVIYEVDGIGIRCDGSLVPEFDYKLENYTKFENIIDIATTNGLVIGLNVNGKPEIIESENKETAAMISKWKNLVSIKGSYHEGITALTADGKVLTTRYPDTNGETVFQNIVEIGPEWALDKFGNLYSLETGRIVAKNIKRKPIINNWDDLVRYEKQIRNNGIRYEKPVIQQKPATTSNTSTTPITPKTVSSTSYQNKPAQNQTSGGCYIATAVYGSYDCPEVWTLRRFRDDVLATSWYGKVFIRAYYAVSPTLVRWFGDHRWFNALWRPWLDRFVKKLQACGFKNSAYIDKRI